MTKIIVIFLLLLCYPSVPQAQDVMGFTWGMDKKEAKKFFKGEQVAKGVELYRTKFLGMDALFDYVFYEKWGLSQIIIILSDDKEDIVEKNISEIVRELSVKYKQNDFDKFSNDKTIVRITTIKKKENKFSFAIIYSWKEYIKHAEEEKEKTFRKDINSL